MKTRKTVIAVLAAVLLISAMLVVGCIEQLDGISEKDTEDNYQVPAGKGRIKFKITDGISRTILPTATLANMHFVFEFEDSSSNLTRYPDTSGTVPWGATISVPLPYEIYSISISAYDDEDETTANLISGWDSGATTYEINSAAAVPVSATLQGICDGSAEGVFNYSITVPAITPPDITSVAYIPNSGAGSDPTSMLLEVSKTSDLASPVHVAVLTPGATANAGSKALDSGVYYVRITTKATNCQPRVINSVMHIYNGLPSTYTATVPVPVQNSFSVKLVGNSPTASADVITTHANAYDFAEPSPPTNSNTNLDFDDWYTTATGGGDVKVTFPVKIFRDTSIYARWKPAAGSGSLNISIGFATFSDVATLAVITGSSPIDYASVLAGSQTVEFEVGGIDTGIRWLLDGNVITGRTVSGVLTIGKTVNNDLLDTLCSGTHILEVFGTKSGDTKEYSARVVFEATYP
jgi:hypothetical protein